MALYLDTSVLVPLIVAERHTGWAQTVVLDTECFVSDFAVAEVASAAARRVRMGGLEAQAAESLLIRFDEWLAQHADFVRTTSDDIVHAGQLVRRFELGLRAPDALHLVLAGRCGAVLATLDEAMARAASTFGMTILPLPA